MSDNESFGSTKPEEIKDFIGRHLIYTYANGWQYELYLKSDRSIDYRIFKGIVGGRWVKDQAVHVVRIADDVVKISWNEPTGTVVSMVANIAERKLHSIIVFPKWIADDPKKTVLFQNEHLEEMNRLRDAGPHYPKLIIDEFAEITFLDKVEPGNDDLISVSPDDLPAGYADRRK